MESSLNLGILAHVDAGKTTLTERILFETGVIAAIGRVDHGTTQTDTLQLERQRGITIQSAVASFAIDSLTVNLIDTPGHADFIAEVDRALQVLDAVVVVISAVEGVQPQTRRLIQAIKAARLPFVIFVNKIDRLGARGLDLLPEIERALGLTPVAMTLPAQLETRQATIACPDLADQAVAGALIDRLADIDDTLVARYVELDGHLPEADLHQALDRAVAKRRVTPVYFGSAVTGTGVRHLLAALPRLAPATTPRQDDLLSAMVFKMQRSPAGEKVALARVFAGTLSVRDHVTLRRATLDGRWEEFPARVTGLERFSGATRVPVSTAAAGAIVRVHGLRDVLIGDVIGQVPARRRRSRFPMPTLESIIRPHSGTDAGQMYAALKQLEEQDPLISIRRGTREPTVSVRLYGEVQKEVIQDTLQHEFALSVAFDPSQTICVERVVGTGAAGEAIGEPDNPFLATVGLRIEPSEEGSGISYHRELGALPLAFYRAIEETVFATLEEGLLGWPVRDCRVTLTSVGMTPVTAAGDFRKLTPLVLMAALRRAGTRVYEPIEQFTLDVPTGDLGELYTRLFAAEATLDGTDLIDPAGERSRITGSLPAAAVDGFERLLPGLTGGTGVFRSRAGGYRLVPEHPPSRPRTDFDPLNRKRYLALVSQA